MPRNDFPRCIGCDSRINTWTENTLCHNCIQSGHADIGIVDLDAEKIGGEK